MTEEQAFFAAIDANPADQTTLLVFADWLNDHYDGREEGYRVMAALGFVPGDLYGESQLGRECYVGTEANDGYIEWSSKSKPDIFKRCLLPDAWFEFVKCMGDRNTIGGSPHLCPADFIWQYFSSFHLAFDCCAIAYAKWEGIPVLDRAPERQVV